MKNIGIVFGSSTGTCEELAGKIAEKLGIEIDNVINAANLSKEKAESYDVLVLGSSTWGLGDLQDDWYDGLSVLKSANLAGKKIALFGCGDSESYPDSFCDAMRKIYDDLQGSSCTFIGKVSTDGYSHSFSESVVDGEFIGLALDEVNESNLTNDRLEQWINNLKTEF